TPTILGNQRTNPYTVSNMRQAYNNLGLTGVAVNVTDLYVRFLPNSAAQLSILDSSLDARGLELFDAPMDYDVLREGDYYQDPSIPDSSVTWQYAVVPPSFQFPSGITYQVLSQLHLPGDDSTAIETEAERLASIQDSINCSSGGGLSRKVTPYVYDCGPGYYWDFNLHQCVCTCCPNGYYWNGTQCAPIPPPPPQFSAPDAQVPAGNITVSDVNLNTTPGVRNVRVVAKRWFKIERIYTDNNGHFHFTKHFKHKVKVIVKFKNDNAVIKSFRLSSYWRMLFPITKTIGVYSSNKSNIPYNFQKYNTSIADKGNLYWAGATAHNSVMEYRDYAVQEGIGLPPDHLKIFLTRWSYGAGMTPMWNKRWYSNLPQEIVINFFLYYAIPPLGDVSAIYTILKLEMDMGISYRAPSSDYTSMYSDDLKETVYHELTHAAQYSALSNSWYTSFVDAEANEIANTAFSVNSPYGDGSNTVNSPIIALGESWAYHMGQYLADKQYGSASRPAGEQGILYSN
ncbi:MAG TPA: hypothetical protein VET23_10310, partial [Chitinophagaceae bacterium]|nr:hypothetical protein [Chitinophagaceae bacterium]